MRAEIVAGAVFSDDEHDAPFHGWDKRGPTPADIRA